MQSWVALLRGINVGGHNKVPMAQLRAVCAALGWTDVRSHIASGNLVFRARGEAGALAAALHEAILAQMGVDCAIIVLPGVAVRAALADCPFDPEAGKQVHAFFCWSDPVIATAMLASLKAETEDLVARGRVVWLFAPDGIGRSKLAERIARVITGTEMTARNLNTVRTLVEMLD
jgi:uncharacterized protein (DUF1697 family)